MNLIYFVAATPNFIKAIKEKTFDTYDDAEKFKETLEFPTSIFAAIVTGIVKVEREVGGDTWPLPEHKEEDKRFQDWIKENLDKEK